MPLTLEEINNIDDFKARIKPYEELYGRKIITPRYYLEKDEEGKPKMKYDEWYKQAKCVCSCGSVVQVRQILQHRKTQKHTKLLDKIQSEMKAR